MIKNIDQRIRRALAAIRAPFRMVISAVQGRGGVQHVSGDGLAGEDIKRNELFQHYGFKSMPPSGTMAVVVPLGGATSHGIIVATEHASFGINLATGEAAIYHKEGHFVHLKNGRIIEAECDIYRVRCKTYDVQATDGAQFDTPDLHATKQVSVDGLLTGLGGLAMAGKGDGPAARIQGVLEATQDVTVDSVSLVGHDHIDSLSGVTTKPRR